MPSKSFSKRTIEEVAAAEDSNDEDYDDKQAGPSPSRRRTARSRTQNRPAKKKKRTGYDGSDIDSDDEEPLSDDSEGYSSEDEPPETNEKGRPIRRAKKEIKYDEGSSDDNDELAHTTTDEDEDLKTPPQKKRKKQLIVKLKLTPKVNPIGRRVRSGSQSGHQFEPPRRRSSRISHDEDEPVIALSSSGRHVEVVRPGSREPEELARASRGGKGIKYPSKSTIDEADEPESMETKLSDNEMEIGPSQHEILESAPASQAEAMPLVVSDLPLIVADDDDDELQIDHNALQLARRPDAEEEDDDEEGVISRGRQTRGAKRKADSPLYRESPDKRTRVRSNVRSTRSRGKNNDESSDFEPPNEGAEDENLSDSAHSDHSPRKSHNRHDEDDSSQNGKRSGRLRRRNAASARTSVSLDPEDELAAEAAELTKESRKKRPSKEEITYEPRGTRRAGKKPNYDLLRNLAPIEDEEEVAAPSPSNRARKPGGGSWQRSLFNTYGPFGGGGAGTLAPVLGGPSRAQGDVDSDSSDDEVMKQPRPLGTAPGMTPIQPSAGAFNPFALQLDYQLLLSFLLWWCLQIFIFICSGMRQFIVIIT
jgi:ATPase family AAA domain-containing protein 2